jgi:hypothetical protein
VFDGQVAGILKQTFESGANTVASRFKVSGGKYQAL